MYSAQTPILSQGVASPETIQRWFAQRAQDGARVVGRPSPAPIPPDLGQTIVAVCREAAQACGHPINHDLVAAQIAHETAFWQSRYAQERNNPAGIGAVNTNPDQAIAFPTPRDGITAQVAHLLTYCLGDHPWKDRDPRYAVTPARNRGAVSTLADLDGRWAVPGNGYGERIAALANELVEQAMDDLIAQLNLVDRRGDLPVNPNGGPNEHVDLTAKQGVVVHYNGPAVPNMTDKDAVWQHIVADANYHIRTIWGYGPRGEPLYGDGLMYHIVIAPDGERWLCRDITAVLWHCGAWPQNATALAVHVPIGGDQHATAAQIQSLAELVDTWLSLGHGTRDQVWGHQELSPTSCPGTLMQDFVYPYREGKLGKGEQMANGRYFPETGHFVGGGFWEYWQRYGGLEIFGYPVSDELTETCEDGKTRTVQYFERAVFEWHPDKPDLAGKWNVLLRRCGAILAKERGLKGPGIPG